MSRSIDEIRNELIAQSNKTKPNSVNPHDVFDNMLEILSRILSSDGKVTLEDIDKLYSRIREFEAKIADLTNILRYGAICGDSNFDARQFTVTTGTEAVNPKDESDIEATEVVKPDTFPPTVPAIAVKLDTAKNFLKNIQNLIDGEPIFTTDTHKFMLYYKGKFYGSSSESGGGDGVSVEELLKLYLDSLGFLGKDSHKYRLNIFPNGELRVIRDEETELVKDNRVRGDVWVNGRFVINSIFCGGDGDEHRYQGCSHNFIELANSSEVEINLKNIYILYAPDSDSPWEVLPLSGVIKPQGSYLIRGAKCSVKTNTTIIDVDKYDIEWKLKDGSLIKFNQKSPTFYLAYGVNGQFYGLSGKLINSDELTRVPYQTPILKGYIDSVGFGEGSGEKGQAFKITSGDSWSDALFVRYYSFDPCNQANKDYVKHSSASMWTYVNLSKTRQSDTINNYSNLPYYDLMRKLRYKPKASFESGGIFSRNSTFDVNRPNNINLTFGREATDSGQGHGATRCINWISVGYYDEYIELIDRKHEGDPLTPPEFIYSINPGELTENNYERFLTELGVHNGDLKLAKILASVYSRIRWETTSGTAVTTHKVILRNLPAGEYRYKVRRSGDRKYMSHWRYFTVRKSDEVKSFNFIQDTDQQGFNWLEYQVWERTCKAIVKSEFNPQFTINTGDISQNGNRENEWIDYYQARDKHLSDIEEMFTIGNNDLCGVPEYNLGDGTASKYKINHSNVNHYYCFELDPDNLPLVTLSNGVELVIPSVYSFNYGEYHFVSLNSEIATNTYKAYQDEPGTFITDVYSAQAEWYKRDLSKWKTGAYNNEPRDCGKALTYMHEMPFTIITHKTAIGTTGRSGSKLNTVQTKGKLFYWSRIFKEYGVRLIFGGHKHTYSMSCPVYDAPTDYLNEESHSVNPDADIWKEVSPAAQMRPIIQVTDATQMKTDVNSVTNTLLGRYEIVPKINAPIYVMCQASGYKLASNQEIPCRDSDHALWLDKYFPGSPKGPKDLPNGLQFRPTIIRYECRPDSVEIHSLGLSGVYSKPTLNKGGKFDINAPSQDPLEFNEIRESSYTITF